MSAAGTAEVRAVRTPPRRVLVWLLVVLVVLAGGLAVAAASKDTGSASFDPSSTDPAGSRALARVLQGYGTRVTATRSLADATSRPGAVVLVTAPDDYSDAQLRSLLRSAARVVLVRPGVRAAAPLAPDSDGSPSAEPRCRLAGARAAGRLDVPDTALVYRPLAGGVACYGGLVAARGRLVVLGSADLLRNDHLARTGVAALDVNLLSADRSAGTLVWLRPGADADGSGGASVWDVFPDSWYRAFVWLIVVGLLAVLWRVRRLGPAVTEPLPVVVRAAEIVEGHGRLYARAGAREPAAAALRSSATRSLARRLGLPPTASPEQVSTAAAPVLGTEAATVFGMLAGRPPATDEDLARLARDLHDLTHPTGRTP